MFSSLAQRDMNLAPLDLAPWRIEGNNILITPDDYRWRIEGTPTVGDLLTPGTLIRTSYGTGGRVIKVRQWGTCCFPHRFNHNHAPTEPDEYHRLVTWWSIVFVPEEAKLQKNGQFREMDKLYVNEKVGFEGRILSLFENNPDEVFIVHRDTEPTSYFQASLSFL